MQVKDRTSEFHAIVDSLISRSSTVIPAEKARLIAPHSLSKSDFAKTASALAKEINSTASKLSKLTVLAKKKSNFDDKPVEINELVNIIKNDITKINKQILLLQDYLKRTEETARYNSQNISPSALGAVMNQQSSEHSKQVVSSLQTKLATTSNEFKHILEVRTANMKEQKTRREQFAGESSYQSQMHSDSPLYHPERKIFDSSSSSAQQPSQMDTIIDFSQVQMQATSNDVATREYIDSRSQAIDSIEATIAELGQIYQNFATLLATQRETVQRIDDNIGDMHVNVEGAHNQLLLFYQNMSGNRMLMLKVFAVLVVFFMAFILLTR